MTKINRVLNGILYTVSVINMKFMPLVQLMPKPMDGYQFVIRLESRRYKELDPNTSRVSEFN